MLDGAYKKKAFSIINDSFESFLNFQTPWGEWEQGFLEYEDRLKTIERLGSEAHKPNMSRTLRALEIINKFYKFNKKNSNLYDFKKNLAMNWIKSQFEKGSFFKSWIEIGRDFDGGSPHFYKINDIRHTIQALISIWDCKRDELFTHKYYEAVTYLFDYINYNNKYLKGHDNKYSKRHDHNKNRECFSYYQGIDEINCKVTNLWAINFFGKFRDEIQEGWIKKVIGEDEKGDIGDFREKLKYVLPNSINYLSNYENDFSESKNKLANIHFYSACLFRISSLLFEYDSKYMQDIVRFISKDYSNGKFVNDKITAIETIKRDGYNIAVIYALLSAKKYVKVPVSHLKEAIEKLINEYFYVREFLNTPDFMNIINILLEVTNYKENQIEQIFQDYQILKELSKAKRDEVVKWLENLKEISKERIDKFKDKKSIKGYLEIIEEESAKVGSLVEHIEILKVKRDFKEIDKTKLIPKSATKKKAEISDGLKRATGLNKKGAKNEQ